jgi:ABC-type glycerol-3-phosphate transport system permease component
VTSSKALTQPKAGSRPQGTARLGRARLGHWLRTGLILLALVALAIVTAIPFVYMITGSFKQNSEMFAYPLTLIPAKPIMTNYQRLLSGQEIPFIPQFVNSLWIAVAQTALSLLISALVGWGFAKYEFRGKKVLFGFLLATMMFPGQVALVPLFLLMVRIGWIDNYAAIILPGAIGAFGAFFMRQSMLSIPNELLDAGRIDGASEFGIFLRIGLPMSGAPLAILAVLNFLGAWNNYLWPLIVLRTASKYTYPVGLATLFGLYKIEYGMILAGSFLATLPILIIFFIGRNQFVTGLTAGAIKG